jgi:Ricin-type beta-trefoil lectin domain-like/Secretion system C-terminal sorting domain
MKIYILTSLMMMLYGWNYLVVNDTIFEKKTPYNINFVNAPPASGKILLPIEVLGAEGIVVSRSFTIDQQTLDATKNIWFMINNLSYENKASIKINGGNWLSLNHLSVQMQKQELLRGGMVHGGFNTVRLSIPMTGLVAGANTIEFRFNKSDGISIGYRVVRMNLLGDNDIRLLPDTMFEEDNPDNWTPPLTDQASINKGKDLWNNAILWNHYLPEGQNGSWYGQKLPSTKIIKAKCASCHTKDGRDLEMFSYSNYSIIERAKFHKLTEEEGKQLASYIRSLSTTKPNVGRYGRPWNPPYQPGPALKNKPIKEWAAGAGIDAVLADDKDMAPYLFPNGITKESVRVAFDSDKMDDRTILPLSIQFPDWKHWLPMIHPIDAYIKNNYIEDPNRLQKPLKAIENLRTYMQAQSPASRDKKQLLNEIRNLWWPFRQFLAEGSADPGHWRTKDGTANMNLAPDVPREYAATSLARLLAVKNFELNVEFDLQDKANWFVALADQPSERQWPNNVYSVFEVPAHFQACVDNNCQQFKGQATATGQYETTAWYNLQYVLNGGNGFVGGTTPTDFNYHAPFIAYASVSSGIPEPLRYYSALNQMYQIRSWSGATGPVDKGFRIRNQGPFHFLGIHQTSNFYYNPPEKWLHFLDDVKPGLSLWVLEAQLLQFLKEMQKPENSLNTWPRLAPDGGDYELDPDTKSTIVDITTQKDFAHYADKMYYVIPKFKAEGVDCSIMNPLIDWCKKAWPLIDFEKFKDVCVTCNTTSITNGATYLIKTKHGKCVEVANNSLVNGANVQQWDCSNGNNQKWQFNDQGNGYYTIKNMNSGKCLDVAAFSTLDGGNVQQWGCTAGTNQQWKVTSLGDCKYSLTARNSNKCLDLSTGGISNATNIQQWSCDSQNANQQFTFELASSLSASFVDIISSTKENLKESGLAIFPNPVNSNLNIEISDAFFDTQAEIIIYDFLGKKLLTQKTTQNQTTINVGNLPSGSYIIKVSSNEVLFTRILMKE